MFFRNCKAPTATVLVSNAPSKPPKRDKVTSSKNTTYVEHVRKGKSCISIIVVRKNVYDLKYSISECSTYMIMLTLKIASEEFLAFALL
jgi:hypothetical protein